MADVIAKVSGVALVPGVSKNKRLYTASVIRGAVERAQERIAGGGMPITAMTHHAAGDDSTRIVGRITKLTVDDQDRALYEMDLADTEHARNLLNLIDTQGGDQFLRGVSIRGAWLGPVKKQSYNGEMVETGDDLELDGLDFTKTPGVDGACIDSVSRSGSGAKETGDRVLIFESLNRATVEIVEADYERSNRKRDNDMEDADEAKRRKSSKKSADEDMDEDYDEAVKNGRYSKVKPKTADTEDDMEAAKAPYGDVAYADPGYQSDKVKRYPIDSAAHVRAAWSYVNMPKNASKYSAGQLKRVKSRIISAAKKFGIKIHANENYISTDAFKIEENGGMVPGGVPLFKEDPYSLPPLGGFCVALNNKAFNVVISSHLIDPADLEVVGHAAMHAAVNACHTLDPDCDGDIDVAGADSDDDDDSGAAAKPMGNNMDMGYECANCGPGCVCGPGCMCPPTGECATECAASETPAAEASGSPTEQEAPAMAEETHAPEATEEAAPSAVETKLDALIAAIGGLAEKLTAPAAVEAAPAAPVAEAQVEETEEARIERLVNEKLTAAVQKHAEEVGVQRKGLVENAAAQASFGGGDFDYPEGWPAKPLHEFTREEQKRFLNPQLEQAIMRQHSVFRTQ